VGKGSEEEASVHSELAEWKVEMPLVRKPRGGRMKGHHSDEDESTPICRCRVLYLGSAVPHITKDGLQGIQEPLKELYPDTGLSSLKGIDSWLSVWSNGLLLENVDEKNTKITRFFPIESLHYCAAVRNVLVPASSAGGSSNEKVQKFLPLDSPFARLPNLNHPPLFACILRRTTGIKVLECHAFICKREMAANALVRCCFHAYADSTYAKQLENGDTLPNSNGYGGTNGMMMMNGGSGGGGGGGPGGPTGNGGSNGTLFKDPDRPIQRSVTPLDSIEKVTGWQALSQNGDGPAGSTDEDFTDGPVSSSTPRMNKYEFSAEFPDEDDIYEGDENHKIWGGSTASGQNGTSELVYLEPDGTLKSVKSHNSRLTKPRQFISPPPPPPPPPQQFSLLKSVEDDASSTKKKTKKKLKKEMKSHQQMTLQQQQHHFQQQQSQKYLVRPASMMNLSSTMQHHQPGMNGGRAGSVLNGPVSQRPGSAMSTLTRTRGGPPPQQMHPGQQHQLIPVNGYGPGMMAHHPHMVPQPIYGHLPPHHGPYAAIPPQLMKGSKSKKKGKQGMLQAVPLVAPNPMPMVPMHHHLAGGAGPNATPPPMYHHHHHQGKMGGGHPEDPKGMKHSPELMMMPSHYATIERGYHYHNSNRLIMNGGHPGVNNNGEMMMMRNGDSSTLVSNKSKSKSSSKDETAGSSPFNTGIYRKKGHLNERAFSYSIRQEHRSRSYGSLANLQFANESGGPLLRPSGSPPHTAEGMKKEREIIQMVRDLDLSGDEIERSQVPPEFYPSKKTNGYHPQSNNLRQQNGIGNHGPRITHR
jgi:hypothetical protein